MDGSHISDSEDYEMADSDNIDRLSELADSLILLILSLLPMRDFVHTTFLSRRWRDLWTTTLCLDFGSRSCSPNFVSGSRAMWRGEKILKFILNFEFKPPFATDIDSWLLCATENQVEELYLDLSDSTTYTNCLETEYYAPQRLYRCSSITKLSLFSWKLKIDENVQWSQLKSLTLEGAYSLTEDAINKVVSGAPQLEVLNLRIFQTDENLNIQSPSLRMIKIDRYEDNLFRDHENNTMLSIWAPNLETLEISGLLYSRCLLNVPSVKNAIFGFHDQSYVEFAIAVAIAQLFQSIPHAENVTLSDLCLMNILEAKNWIMIAPLSNAKFLKVHGTAAHQVLGVLDMFPKLTMLILERKVYYDYFLASNRAPAVINFDSHELLERKTYLPIPSLQHLRTVEVTWLLRDTSIFPVIEIMLENAELLEKMVFWARLFGANPESLPLAEEKLLSMPRSSPTAEVIIIKD